MVATGSSWLGLGAGDGDVGEVTIATPVLHEMDETPLGGLPRHRSKIVQLPPSCAAEMRGEIGEIEAQKAAVVDDVIAWFCQCNPGPEAKVIEVFAGLDA